MKKKQSHMYDIPLYFEDWSVENINRWSKQPYGTTEKISKEERADIRRFSEVKKKFKLRLKILKAIADANIGIDLNWEKYKTEYHSYNHIIEFIEVIISHCMIFKNDITMIGVIEIHDDGTRGLAKTWLMSLWDKEHSKILIGKTLHQNKYYFM